MKKKVLSFAMLLMLCVVLTVPAFAADIPRLTDVAGLLSEDEYFALNEKLDTISEELEFDVAVGTLDSLNGVDVEEASCEIYDQYGFGYGDEADGVILLISMEERDWVITSTGFGEEAVGLQQLIISDGGDQAERNRYVTGVGVDLLLAFFAFLGEVLQIGDGDAEELHNDGRGDVRVDTQSKQRCVGESGTGQDIQVCEDGTAGSEHGSAQRGGVNIGDRNGSTEAVQYQDQQGE